jgi:hypothetical protein
MKETAFFIGGGKRDSAAFILNSFSALYPVTRKEEITSGIGCFFSYLPQI